MRAFTEAEKAKVSRIVSKYLSKKTRSNPLLSLDDIISELQIRMQENLGTDNFNVIKIKWEAIDLVRKELGRDRWEKFLLNTRPDPPTFSKEGKKIICNPDISDSGKQKENIEIKIELKYIKKIVEGNPITVFSKVEKTVFDYLLRGYCQAEIARKTGKHYSNISQIQEKIFRKIRIVYDRY